MQTRKAFTIIEILIVVGVISILAVALLVLINPAEAQRRTRDTKRLKDAQFMDSIIKQYLDDGGTAFADNTVCTSTDMCFSNSGVGADAIGTADTVPCDTTTAYNWLGENNVDFCTYAKAIPVDPLNQAGATCVDDSVADPLDLDTSCNVYYAVVVSGQNYEVAVRQESPANVDKVARDSGNSDEWYELFTTGSNDLIGDDIYNGGSTL